MLHIGSSDLPVGDQMVHHQARIDMLQLEQSRLAAEFEASGQWDLEGFNSAYDWIRINCKVPGHVAGNYLAVGAHMAELERSVKAVLKNEISYAHLAVMAHTAEAVGKAFDETKLLPLAKEHSPGQFYFKCLHYRHSLDAKKYAEEQSDFETNHHLTLTTVESGHLLINGVLDPVGGAALRMALEPLARKSGEHDDRKLPQRYADALVEFASAGKPANIQVTATIETLKGLAGAAAGEMEFSLPISSLAVQRMACDCSVTRVLLSQESLVMDVGRAKPIVSSPLRRGLNGRDGHVPRPGGERPASKVRGRQPGALGHG